MKYWLILILFISCIAHAQEVMYPEVFQNIKGVKVIKAFSGDTLVHAYSASPDGKIISCTDYYNEKAQGKEMYSYENGKIVSLRSYQEREYTYDLDGNSTSYSPTDFKWDSAKVTFEIKRTYGPEGIISYKHFVNPGNVLVTDISYTYTRDGKLKKEEIKTSPKPGVEQYTSNTEQPASAASRYKIFAYEPNLTTIYYYVNGKLTGTENITTTTDGRITNRVVKNSRDKTISWVNYNYNTQGQLVDLVNNDTGEDGFGKGHPVMFDRELYTYDMKGRMIVKQSFLKGKPVHAFTYKYE